MNDFPGTPCASGACERPASSGPVDVSSTEAPAASAAGVFFAPGTQEAEIDGLAVIASLRLTATRWNEGNPVKAVTVPAFASWLLGRVVFVAPRSRAEILRFRSALGLGSVIRNKRGGLVLQGAAADAYNAFATGSDWLEGRIEAAARYPQEPALRKRRKIEFLRARDGDACVYCGRAVSEADQSIEHFLATSRGGADVAANWGLAHEKCNREAGDLPVAEKIAIALRRRCASQGASTRQGE